MTRTSKNQAWKLSFNHLQSIADISNHSDFHLISVWLTSDWSSRPLRFEYSVTLLQAPKPPVRTINDWFTFDRFHFDFLSLGESISLVGLDFDFDPFVFHLNWAVVLPAETCNYWLTGSIQYEGSRGVWDLFGTKTKLWIARQELDLPSASPATKSQIHPNATTFRGSGRKPFYLLLRHKGWSPSQCDDLTHQPFNLRHVTFANPGKSGTMNHVIELSFCQYLTSELIFKR